jgi:hypothetical protein
MKRAGFSLLLGAVLAGMLSIGCGGSSDDSPKANARLTNQTGFPISNISGGGATWTGPYATGATTEQKPIATGQVHLTWTCNGSQQLTISIDPGNWRVVLFDCAAVNVTIISE